MKSPAVALKRRGTGRASGRGRGRGRAGGSARERASDLARIPALWFDGDVPFASPVRDATDRAARRRRPAAPRADRRPGAGSSAGAVVARIRGLPDHSLVVGLVRDRIWIVVLGILLAGIVGLNVAVLKLNATITSNAERIETLQSRSSELRLTVSRLASPTRIAEELPGMRMPEAGEIEYIDPVAAGDNVARRSASGSAPVAR